MAGPDKILALLDLAEEQRGVVPAETEIVTHRDLHISLAHRVRHLIEIAIRIGLRGA